MEIVFLEFGNWFEHVLALLGLLDLYIAYRFVHKKGRGIVDQTAGMLSWWFVKWTCASQTALVARTMTFISKDLTEWLGFRKDDGEIT